MLQELEWWYRPNTYLYSVKGDRFSISHLILELRKNQSPHDPTLEFQVTEIETNKILDSTPHFSKVLFPPVPQTQFVFTLDEETFNDDRATK